MSNRFLTDILPKALVDAQEKRKQLEYGQREIADKLDYDEEWGDHECDCEYCESNTRERKPLDYDDREELETLHAEQAAELAALDLEIRRMTSYKEFMAKQAAS